MSSRQGTVLITAAALATILLCAGSAQAVAVDDMLSISPPADITTSANMPCGQSYCAQVYFSFTASGGSPPYNFVCGANPGSLFLVGSHTVGCLAQDSKGNSTPTATFTITVTPYVRDTTPPEFHDVPGAITQPEDPSGNAAVVYFTHPTAIDDHDGSVGVQCQPSNGGGDSFPLGTTTVTCTAWDSSGNTGTVSFTVTVTRRGAGGATTTVPATTTAAGTTTSTPTTPPPPQVVTTTVTQPTATTGVVQTPAEQSLQDQINALSAQIAALRDRVTRAEKAGDAAWLAFEQAVADGATYGEAAALARGTYLNALYGLGEFAP